MTLDDGILTVDMDGAEVLSAAVDLGPQVLVGFSGGDGSVTDTHSGSRHVDPLRRDPPTRPPGSGGSGGTTGRPGDGACQLVPAD